jgi:DoxX-like family
MSAATTALAGTVAVFFTVLGTAKIRAVPAMRQRAAHVGMSTSAYRRIGALEVAGAAGVLVGLAEPRIGGLAGAGLLALLGGALIAHRRTGDGLRETAPAFISAAAVAAYLGALWGRRSRDRTPRH